MSVSPPYLEATVIAAAVARERGDLEVFINISQMTVSQMTLAKMTDSPQQRQHLLAEQVLNWSGLPTVHVRPTVFLENFFFLDWAAESIARDDTIQLPFGAGRTSPVAAQDVAEVIAIILSNPAAHVGKVYELTGPRSQDMHAVAAEYSSALGRSIKYVDVPLEQWRDQELRNRNLPEHVFEHLLTMARLHSANRYDRITQDVEAITGRPALGIRNFIAKHADLFAPNRRRLQGQVEPISSTTGRKSASDPGLLPAGTLFSEQGTGENHFMAARPSRPQGRPKLCALALVQVSPVLATFQHE